MADYDGFDPSDHPEKWFRGEIGPLRPDPSYDEAGEYERTRRLRRTEDAGEEADDEG